MFELKRTDNIHRKFPAFFVVKHDEILATVNSIECDSAIKAYKLIEDNLKDRVSYDYYNRVQACNSTKKVREQIDKFYSPQLLNESRLLENLKKERKEINVADYFSELKDGESFAFTFVHKEENFTTIYTFDVKKEIHDNVIRLVTTDNLGDSYDGKFCYHITKLK